MAWVWKGMNRWEVQFCFTAVFIDGQKKPAKGVVVVTVTSHKYLGQVYTPETPWTSELCQEPTVSISSCLSIPSMRRGFGST